MNIAWNTANSFGNDVGDTPLDVNAFENHIKNIRKAGGNAVRWWLHTDASRCPKLDNDGKVTGLGTKTIENIEKALDIAYEYGVVVSLTLFSFDLLQPGDGAGKASYSDYNIDRNYKFLTVPENLDTYINNALIPILNAVGSHPAIMAWEVFNEPEGMATEYGWSSQKIAHSNILRFTNKIAGEVHRRTKKMASTGIHNFHQYKGTAVYSDARLKAAGGDDNGWLDFYMAHTYPEYESSLSTQNPFYQPASYWGFDRPLLIGEFPAQSWVGTGGSNGYPYGASKNIIDLYEYAYNNGYCGLMSWSMTEGDVAKFGNYTTTAPALENLFEKYESAIKIKDVEIEELTGDLAMKLAITNLPVLTENWSELGVNKDLNFSGKSNLTFEMYIKTGSGTNLDINVVVKVGDDWDWTPGQIIKLNDYEQGKWVTVTIPVSSFGSGNLSQVKSLLFQYGATTSSYTGEIYFDNIKLDGAIISDFDDGAAWSLTADNSNVSIVTRSSVTPISQPVPQATQRINLATLDFSTAKVYDMHGNRVSVNSFENLKGLPAGVYIVKTPAGRTLYTSR
jgi:hypothetical protein